MPTAIMKDPKPRERSFWDASATEKNHASITAAFFVHWFTLSAFSQMDIMCRPCPPERTQPLKRSLKTIFSVSVAMEPVIFE